MNKARLRLLVFAPRSHYINPFEEEFFAELPRQCDVVFYGPGFVPIDELELDARKVFDRYGPFNAALLHQYFLLDSLPAAAGSCHFPFDVKRFCRRLPKFPIHFSELPCLKIAQIMRMDVYAASRRMIDVMNDFPGYFFAKSVQFTPPLDALQDVDREAWEVPPTDNYYEFARENFERIIPHMHTVAENLFCRPPNPSKKWPVYVPGQLYAVRRDAVRQLRAAGYRVANRSHLMGAMSRIASLLTGRPLFANPYGIRYLQESFRRRIRQTLVCFTDGSRLRWPLRKYFEIPAFGSLLVCEPFLNADALGFVAGENFVAAAPEQLPDIVQKATADAEWAYGMIGTLQKMVWQHHTPHVRVAQLVEAMRAVLDGRYRGGTWSAGRLNFHTDVLKASE